MLVVAYYVTVAACSGLRCDVAASKSRVHRWLQKVDAILAASRQVCICQWDDVAVNQESAEPFILAVVISFALRHRFLFNTPFVRIHQHCSSFRHRLVLRIVASEILPQATSSASFHTTIDMTTGQVGTVLDTLATIFGVGVDLSSFFGQKDNIISNAVRIYAGEQTPDDSASGVDIGKSPGGHVPGVSIWDVVGSLIGTKEGDGTIGRGSFHEYSFDTGADQRAASYISVSAGGSDGLCIAAITMTTSSGNDYAWFGDVGKLCGVPWYYSSTQLKDKIPNCVWIDTNADKGHKYNGLSVHMPSFWNNNREAEQVEARVQQLIQNPELMCKSKPRFSMWDNIIPENDIPMFLDVLEMSDGPDSEDDQKTVLDPARWSQTDTGYIKGPIPKFEDGSVCFPHPDDCHPSGPSAEEDLTLNSPVGATKRKRGLRRRQEVSARVMPDDLRISSFAQHSARQLCEDAMSEGPDFVSLAEGLFCDMSTLDNRKQLYPLCSATVTTTCFDLDTYSIRGAGGGTVPLYTTNTTTAGLTLGSTTAVARIAAAVPSVPSKAYTNVQTWG